MRWYRAGSGADSCPWACGVREWSGVSYQEQRSLARDTHTNLKLRGYLVNTLSDLTLLPPGLLGHCPVESQETCGWVHAGGEQIWMGAVICIVSRNKHPFSFEIHCDCLCTCFAYLMSCWNSILIIFFVKKSAIGFLWSILFKNIPSH